VRGPGMGDGETCPPCMLDTRATGVVGADARQSKQSSVTLFVPTCYSPLRSSSISSFFFGDQVTGVRSREGER